MDDDFVPRIGVFFILIGIGLIVMFVGSGASGNSQVVFLLGSLTSFGIGYLLQRKRKPPPPSERFRLIRKPPQVPPAKTDKTQKIKINNK